MQYRYPLRVLLDNLVLTVCSCDSYLAFHPDESLFALRVANERAATINPLLGIPLPPVLQAVGTASSG